MKQILLVPETGPGWNYEADDVLLLVTVEDDAFRDHVDYFVLIDGHNMATDWPGFLGILVSLPCGVRVDIMARYMAEQGLALDEIQVLVDTGAVLMSLPFEGESLATYRGDPDLAEWTVFELLFMPNGVIQITGGEIWVDVSKELLM